MTACAFPASVHVPPLRLENSEQNYILFHPRPYTAGGALDPHILTRPCDNILYYTIIFIVYCILLLLLLLL